MNSLYDNVVHCIYGSIDDAFNDNINNTTTPIATDASIFFDIIIPLVPIFIHI